MFILTLRKTRVKTQSVPIILSRAVGKRTLFHKVFNSPAQAFKVDIAISLKQAL